MKVTVFHNIATDPQGRHLAWDGGYRPGHPLVPVFRYTSTATGDMAICEDAYHLFNVGEDPTFGTPDPRAVQYRRLGNRSLSKGDVLLLHDPAGPRWLACASVGWEAIEPPAWLAHRVAGHGTQPWGRDDHLRDVELGPDRVSLPVDEVARLLTLAAEYDAEADTVADDVATDRELAVGGQALDLLRTAAQRVGLRVKE